MATKPTPKSTPKVKLKNPSAVAERLLAERVKAGKVKDIAKTKSDIAKKTGVWANGKTN